ncbi:MAG: DUF1302 domain-containing protein [Halieaceae bacterium]
MRYFQSSALLTAAFSLCAALPAQAVKFNWGEIDGSFTSTLSAGASWRMEDADKDFLSPGNSNGKGRASSSTTDDGNLNFDKNDMYSLQLKGLHDLELNYGNIGFFTRVKYWYDYQLDDNNVDHGHVPNNYDAGEQLKVGDFEDLAQDSGFEFLDYYLYANTDIGNMPVEMRAGNMVLSWGESTFIQNSINVINPFDVTALRKPGSEIKEALLPTGMVYTNIGLTGDLSLEMFYQYEWNKTIIDECGTYWNAADVYGGGCNKLTVSTDDPDGQQLVDGNYLDRAPDDNASSSGQWGISARYFVEALNGTEFGLYYVNLHSRTPILSGINPVENFGQPFLFGAEPLYNFEFPEDIDVYAVSFATNIGQWAVSGEVSHRPDMPLQINTVELVQALALGNFAEWSRMLPRSQAAGPGGKVRGYDEVEYTQAQFTFINFFDRVLGASRLNFAAEIGGAWVNDMDNDQNYGRSATFGIGNFQSFTSGIFGVPITCEGTTPLGVAPNSQGKNCTNDGFTDDFSWGYRVRASLEYPSVIAGINFTPNMAWSHDVDGYSPAPNFVEDRMALSLGVTADYLTKYKADLSYTSFFNADYNELQDRDFLSLSFSVAF